MESSKAPIDAGWNDPPKFSYNESIEHTKSPKRNFLNKRVAFPLDMSAMKTSVPSFKDPTAAPCNNPNLPPPPTSFMIPNSNINANNSILVGKETISNTNSNVSCETLVDNDATSFVTEINIEEILSTLNSVVEDKHEFLCSNNKEEHIKKKLQILKDSWNANKLSDDIKKQIFELTKALKNGNKNEANNIQVALMVDYPNICSEFISALRQLINVEESM